MSSRDDILGRVRANLRLDPATAAARRAAVEATLATPRQGPRPAVGGDLVARFRDKSLAMSSSVDSVPTLAELPAAVARHLAAGGLGRKAVAWPEFARLDWAAAGLELEFRPPVDADPVGITGCHCALAETGTLMLLSGPGRAAATSLLPETHIAVVPASRIVSGMEEGFALLRAEYGQLPRAVNFVSGPSRTGDIEQTIVIGAHGPYRVHLILVDGA